MGLDSDEPVGGSGIALCEKTKPAPLVRPVNPSNEEGCEVFNQIIGKYLAKRALMIAAARGHHMLMIGPPGTGKTMLAKCLVDLLPDLDLLREPIETGEIAIARAQYRASFPCRFQLIAAMNPCPAGRSCKEHSCGCTPSQVQRYQSRISGRLMDRIDLNVPVPKLDQQTMLMTHPETPDRSGEMQWEKARQTIILARQCQTARQGCLIARVNGSELTHRIQQADLHAAFLTRVTENFELSLRNYHKLWRIALTLADLEWVRENPGMAEQGNWINEQHVRAHYILDALRFRPTHWGYD